MEARKTATKASIESNRSNRRAVRAIVFPVQKQFLDKKKNDDPAKSKELPEDPFSALSAEGKIIEPPFDLLTLAMLSEHNSELGQCVTAMESNIDGFGYRFVPRLRPDRKLQSEVEHERIDLENFFMYVAGEDSFTKLRKKTRVDIEHTGNAWWEVLRNRGGDIVGFNHIPSYQMRLGTLDSEPIKIKQPILRLGKGGEVTVDTKDVWRRFRPHVQSRTILTQRLTTIGSSELRWFKEFGDPRHYHYKTGNLDGENGVTVDPAERANEVIHFRLYCPRSPYGLPRFIGNLISILGDRKSEEINYITFLNNNIPSMALLISNGQITEATIERIKEFVEAQIQGSDNYSKFLIIEGEPTEMDTGEDLGQVKIELKPLTSEQHTDALFQKYSRNNQDKVRRAFRLPPIFVGRCHSEDTEYLSEHGWKQYQAIGEEALATMNPTTGEIEFQKPTARHCYDFEGELVQLKNRGLDALITPNHRMWTRPTVARMRAEKTWGFCDAGELARLRSGDGGCVEIPVAASWQGERFENFMIPRNDGAASWDLSKSTKNPTRDLERYEARGERMVNGDDFLAFLGYFVAEGSTTDTPGPITLSQNAGPVADKMVALLRALGFEPGIIESRPGQLKIDICHVGLWAWLREYCGHNAADKRLPDWVLGVQQRQLEMVLDCMVEGDGSEPELGSDGAFTYSTASTMLNGQLHEICLKLGIALTTRRVDRSAEGWQDLYASYGHYDKRHLLQVDTQITSVSYQGKVACFTVPNGLLVTRRNGRVLISGNSDDYTRATAESSRRLADEQVFAPERNDFDDFVNRILFPVMGIRFHKFKSNSPNTTDNTELVRILAGAEKTGGLTPRIARIILTDILGIELPEFPSDFPADVPFSMTMAEAVKNKADPSEPGQQVTAVKAIETIQKLTGSADSEAMLKSMFREDEVMSALLRMQKRLEEQWSEETEEMMLEHSEGEDEGEF